MISHERWWWTHACAQRASPNFFIVVAAMCFHKSKVKWDSGDLIRFHSRNVSMSSIVLELNELTIQRSSRHSVQRCHSRPVRYMQLKHKWHSFTISKTMTRASCRHQLSFWILEHAYRAIVTAISTTWCSNRAESLLASKQEKCTTTSICCFVHRAMCQQQSIVHWTMSRNALYRLWSRNFSFTIGQMHDLFQARNYYSNESEWFLFVLYRLWTTPANSSWI